MPIYSYRDRTPRISRDAYIHPTATIIGSVRIGPGCFIGPGAVLRGDHGEVAVGARSSIQDNCVVHAQPGRDCIVGDDVTVGHGSVLHGCILENRSLVGMGSTVSDFAVVGEDAILGEGALLPGKGRVPPRSLAVGVPAKVKAELSDEQIMRAQAGVQVYVDHAMNYPIHLKQVELEDVLE